MVDDEVDTRELMQVMLTQCGAEVETAASAEEALAKLERAHYNLLVSDIGMPGVDGYELLRRVRRLPAERGGKLPAIALTAYARTESRLRALRTDYQMHVPKPVDMAELLAVITSVLR